jgi:hypothetical protein
MMGGFPNGQQNGDGQQPAMPDDGNMGGFPDMGNGGSSVSIAAGDTITILDESGNTIYTAKAVRSAGYVLFSSPELTSGSTYTLSINGAETATATASESVSGGMGGGGHMGGGQRPTQPTPPEDGQQPTTPDDGTDDSTDDGTVETITAGSGDLDGNGIINNKDIVILARYLVGFGPLSDSEMSAADYNGDGKVGNMDLVKLLIFVVFGK